MYERGNQEHIELKKRETELHDVDIYQGERM